MEEAKEVLKRVMKVAVKSLLRFLFPTLLIIAVVIILLSAAVYFITIDDGTYKEDDWSSIPYAAHEYMSGVSADSEGTLTSDVTEQELWDKIHENNGRADEYLDSPEELAKLMKAEIVTQYPDTRENPDEEINWEDIVSSDTLQGIIKFKRSDSDNNKTTMSYVDPETFQSYIDEYNSNGSETAKENALTHFTLKKSSNSTSTSTNYTGPDLYWPVDGTTITSYYGPRTAPTAGASTNHGAIDIAANVGDNVYACETGTVTYVGDWGNGGSTVIIDHGNGYKTLYMHNSEFKVSQGDVVSKGQIIALAGATGNVTGPHCHFQVEYNGEKIDPLGFKYSNGMGEGTGGFGTSETSDEEDTKDNEDNEDNKENEKETTTAQRATVSNVNGDGYSEEYTSSAGITYKHYKQYEGAYAEKNYWDGTIHTSGCGPTSIAILASGLTSLNYTPEDIASDMAYTSYETLQNKMNSLGMTSEVIQSPSADDITNNLKNGKVMLVSVDSNTIFTGRSHIMAIVDINSNGQVYVCNPGSSSLYGWYDTSEIMKGCQYIVVTDAGATGIASSSNNSAYTAVVATWKQVDTTITSDDPNVEQSSQTQYTMTTTNINYEEMVEPYTMPFDFLWALLVVGEDKDFVFELADLVYGSDIQITVYDNLTVNTDVDEWHYTQKTKAVVDATFLANSNGTRLSGNLSNDIHDPHEEIDYTTTKTVVTKTNTVNTALTRANVWIVDYQNDYTYVSPTQSTTSNKVTKEDEQYPDDPDSTGNSYSCEHINAKKQELSAQVIAYAKAANPKAKTFPVTFENETINVEYYNKYVDIYDNITNTTSTQKYIEGTPSTKEKTDRDADEDNFVTIFNKSEYRKNKSNIESVTSWLFEIIESNDNIKDMLDLTKYLLYKATGKSYGIEEYDFSEYDVSAMQNVTTGVGANYSSLNLTDDDIEILYKITSAERGGGTKEQQEYVVSVILNRVLSSNFPNNVHDVVFAPYQFEPTRNGAYDRANPSQTTKDAVNNVLATGDKAQFAVYFMTPAASLTQSWLSNCIFLFNDENDNLRNTNNNSTHNFYTTSDIQKELQQYVSSEEQDD